MLTDFQIVAIGILSNIFLFFFFLTSQDLATEIILTLGQAFEVAYQIALRKSTPTPQAPSPIDNHTVNATTNDDSVVQKEQK